ncbi:MAG: hypothetical protein ABIP48_05010 [Planctomycetota bacterium]
MTSRFPVGAAVVLPHLGGGSSATVHWIEDQLQLIEQEQQFGR